MKGFKSKKGISLIVLVITIIVMIILAAAIILSLNNSGIIDKANKAKKDSDVANLKEYANVLEAEWELMNPSEREETGKSSSTEYVNAKLQDKGYTNAYYGEDKVLYIGAAAEFVKNGVKIGDTITGYVLSEKNKTSTTGTENTYQNGAEVPPKPALDITRDDDITWTYIGVDEEGNARIAGSVTSSSPKLTVSGKGGARYVLDVLNTVCSTLYSSNMGEARNINLDDVKRVLEYTEETAVYQGPKGDNHVGLIETSPEKTIEQIAGELNMWSEKNIVTPDGKDAKKCKTKYVNINSSGNYKAERKTIIFPSSSNNSYWISSPSIYADFITGGIWFGAFMADSSAVSIADIWLSNGFSGLSAESEYAIRPSVALSPDIKLESVSDNTWKLK